jgi:TatA/E family protein of Tat protein translocase
VLLSSPVPPYLWGANRGRYHEVFMHFGDSIFIFLLALVLFGPKKLPEIGRTIGKLLAEFRRASNEFKFQIQEELRSMEEDERRKKLADLQAAKAAETLGATDATAAVTTPTESTPTILPPSTGSPVSTSAPYAMPVAPAEATLLAGTVEPSAAEVVVDPPAPTASLPTTVAADEAEPVDLTGNSNGHPPTADASGEAEAVPSSVSGETLSSEALHHG